MKRQPNKKNKNIFQIYGINGCSNILNQNKLNILRIDIMIGGNAEKKTWFDNIIKEKKHQIHHISKNEFLI